MKRKKTKWFFPPHHEKHVQRQTTLNGARLDTGKQGGTHSVLTVSLTSVQRVPALRGFWDFKKTALRKIRASGTVGGPLLTEDGPNF